GQYAGYPAYARQFDSMGLGQEAAAAAEACRTGRFAEVSTELVNAVTLGGDVQEARLRLDAYRAAGVDLAVVYPVAAGADGLGSVRSTLTALAPGA
ncbi:MAG: hypothetical protein QOE25_1018, partial [Actinomycetota bacterium]|nr:hypothetical protein [Actinomycetota bacterium]